MIGILIAVAVITMIGIYRHPFHRGRGIGTTSAVAALAPPIVTGVILLGGDRLHLSSDLEGGVPVVGMDLMTGDSFEMDNVIFIT